MSRWMVFAIVAALVPLSGCLDDSEPTKTDPRPTGKTGVTPRTPEMIRQAAYGEIQALMTGVPCTVQNVGAATSGNLKFLNNLTWERGGSAEVDIKGDRLIAARSGGFSLINISQPLKPYYYANYTESGGSLDVKFSPDNQTVFVGAGYGIDVVDITNPFAPIRSSQWRFDTVQRPPSGLPLQNAHMLYTAHIAGKDWMFVAPNTNTGVWILEIVGAPAERTLKFVTQTLPVQGGPLGPHDMYIQYDTVAKKWYLYSADGFHGWTVFDVNDPTKPVLVGGLIKPETGYTHTIQAAKIGNRRIVATIAEVGVNILQVYDATVINAPVLLGVWQVTPGSATPQHNFNIVDGKLYLAHYGQGLFVFDLTKIGNVPVAGTQNLQPMAHYAAGGGLGFTDFWDVVLKDGLLYGSNMRNGVHIIGFGCNEPGKAALTSDG